MKYCSECATPVEFSIPEGDSVPRFHCPTCHTIHYQNPRLITGTLPVWQGRVLLCRRSIEPRHGYWTLPGGFMENGETLEEGALRETVEEACNEPELAQMLSAISLPQFNQVHIFYLARMRTADVAPTPESSEVVLFEPEQIPWTDIAFRTVFRTLEHYVEHRDRSDIPLLSDWIRPRPRHQL